MQTETLIDPEEVVLAQEVLADGEGPLLAVTATFGTNGWKLTLATYLPCEGKWNQAVKPVPLCPDSLQAARRLAEQAVKVLPYAGNSDDNLDILGADGELVMSAIGTYGTVILIGLGWVDKSGVIVIRHDDLPALVRVLQEAELELASRGFLSLPKEKQH
jgi:hypothetical protein